MTVRKFVYELAPDGTKQHLLLISVLQMHMFNVAIIVIIFVSMVRAVITWKYNALIRGNIAAKSFSGPLYFEGLIP